MSTDWIVVSDFHVPLRMNCNNFGDPLTFPLSMSPSSGQKFNLSTTSIYDQTPAKLMKFP